MEREMVDLALIMEGMEKLARECGVTARELRVTSAAYRRLQDEMPEGGDLDETFGLLGVRIVIDDDCSDA